MTDREQTIQVLRAVSGKFHELLAAQKADEFIKQPMPEPLRLSLARAIRTHEQRERICAEGFEQCVRELARLGDSDVTIFECGAKDIDDGTGGT